MGSTRGFPHSDQKTDAMRLGFLTIPTEGDFHIGKFVFGVLWACMWVTIVFNLADIKGPAVYLSGTKLKEACANTLIVTAVWILMYYNYVGVQVAAIFFGGPFEIWNGKEDVSEKFAPNAARFAGNMFEQSVAFLPALWMYTLFCDHETGGFLGALYMVSRGLYPFYYIIFGKFTLWFESCTQIGYGTVGTFCFGVLYQAALGKEWGKFADENQVLVPILGFWIGSFATLPGIPLTIPYLFIHYKIDRARIAAQASVAVQPAPEAETAAAA